MMESIDVFQALDLIPYPLAIVTAGDPGRRGRRGGAAVAWLTRVSWDPPLVAVALGLARYTYELIKEFRSFAVHLVSRELEDVAYNVFGSVSGRDVDKFDLAKIVPVRARKVTAPIIGKAPLILECELVDEHVAGDHVVVIGRVVEAYRGSAEKPLVFYNGSSAELKL